MKTFFLFLLLFLFVSKSYSQDIIVRQENDTIPCKILDVNDESITFQIKKEDIKTTNTISKKYIKSYHINADRTYQESVLLKKKKESSFRMAFAGGYAYRLGRILESGNSRLDQMSKDLKSGYNLDGEIQYFFDNRCGIALNISSVYTNAGTYNVTLPNFGYASSYGEEQRITFIGPAFATRMDDRKWLITASAGLGAVFYDVNSSINGMRMDGSQTTFGMNVGFGAEYKLSDHWAAGLKLSSVLSSTKSMNVYGRKVEFDEVMSLSDFAIGAYISFRTK